MAKEEGVGLVVRAEEGVRVPVGVRVTLGVPVREGLAPRDMVGVTVAERVRVEVEEVKATHVRDT